ncbi:bactofilin family protein [Labilithrix luteola]|uniref:bactofilin family protein n=1 Tax=Labilithrix luteola TaxID=1391654 RepID=UPI0011BAD662|nr:polymer-forming cytoskeletal protein [Labilithrix luteola]
MARTTRSNGEAGREAVIGRATRVRGRVSGDGDLLIEGSIEGDITLRGDLTLIGGARATSNVEAQAVTVQGELDGDILARGVVRIEAGARVHGDVRGELVAIEDGAEFNGRLDADFDLPPELTGTAGTGRRR